MCNSVLIMTLLEERSFLNNSGPWRQQGSQWRRPANGLADQEKTRGHEALWWVSSKDFFLSACVQRTLTGKVEGVCVCMRASIMILSTQGPVSHKLELQSWFTDSWTPCHSEMCTNYTNKTNVQNRAQAEEQPQKKHTHSPLTITLTLYSQCLTLLFQSHTHQAHTQTVPFGVPQAAAATAARRQTGNSVQHRTTWWWWYPCADRSSPGQTEAKVISLGSSLLSIVYSTRRRAACLQCEGQKLRRKKDGETELRRGHVGQKRGDTTRRKEIRQEMKKDKQME